MKAGESGPASVSAYIAGFPPDVRAVLRRMRATIRKSAPGAAEKISYGIPAYVKDGVLAYFAGFSGHVSFFPTSSGIRKFGNELEAYETSKGTVRFPLGTRVPYGLIARIVRFRVKENQTRAAAKRKRK